MKSNGMLKLRNDQQKYKEEKIMSSKESEKRNTVKVRKRT